MDGNCWTITIFGDDHIFLGTLMINIGKLWNNDLGNRW